jgi:hypothetical protein
MRDALARTRRENTRERMERKRDAMTGAEVQVAMEKIIRDKLQTGDPISLDDFRRANLPLGTVRNSFERVLATVRAEKSA